MAACAEINDLHHAVTCSSEDSLSFSPTAKQISDYLQIIGLAMIGEAVNGQKTRNGVTGRGCDCIYKEGLLRNMEKHSDCVIPRAEDDDDDDKKSKIVSVFAVKAC